jgi:transglutaminase-like putative cysteine protease
LRYEIRHSTRYSYSEPVYLDRHILRLRPAGNANQRLLNFDLRIEPRPAGCTSLIDLDGNEAVAVWFNGTTDSLEVETQSQVETLRLNPFDYLWDGDTTLPLEYLPAFTNALAPYTEEATVPEVEALSYQLASEAGFDAQSFLSLVARELHSRLHKTERIEGAPLPPNETLSLGGGSCRDITVLYMALVRRQGFAARFVSGYHAPAGHESDFQLHAWPEVYTPGGGWRGYDPTTGLAVADRHIALASGALASQAAPVSGSIFGAAQTLLETKVSISARS